LDQPDGTLRADSAGLNCTPQIPQRDYKSHCFGGTRIETERKIKTPSFLGNRVNDDTANSDAVGGLINAQGSIAKHCSTDTLSLVGLIDR